MKETSKSKCVRKYEDILKKICNVEDLHYLRGKEWEGCLGVACVISFMEGVPANLQAFGKHLSMSPYNQSLGTAFSRLKANGIFDDKYNAMKDTFLRGEAEGRIMISPEAGYVTAHHVSELAWCHIAGVAGGSAGFRNVDGGRNKARRNDQ